MRFLLCLLCLFVVSCEESTPRSEATYNISQIVTVKLSGKRVIVFRKYWDPNQLNANNGYGVWRYWCRSYDDVVSYFYEFELE